MTNIDLNDMKDVFLFSKTYGQVDKMLYFIQTVLEVKTSAKRDLIDYYVICVDPNEYERVLLEGRKFAIENNYGILWIDCYGNAHAPIASMNIGVALLPEVLIDGETYEDDRNDWHIDGKTPASIIEYFSKLKEYLGSEIIRIDREYSGNAIIIKLVTIDLDFKKYENLLAQFVIETGNGPFTGICPLTFTGEFVEEPFKVRKIGQK